MKTAKKKKNTSTSTCDCLKQVNKQLEPYNTSHSQGHRDEPGRQIIGLGYRNRNRTDRP
jgi:hypothetical protein